MILFEVLVNKKKQKITLEVDILSNNRHLVNPNAKTAMENLKYEVAEELGLDDDIKERGFAEMTTREVGLIGGNMVKKMIKIAEDQLANEKMNAQK